MAFSIPDIRDQRVLITGGLGFIGSNLAHRLVASGAKVVLYDALLPQYGGNIAAIEEIEKKVKVVNSDVRDPDALAKEVRDCEVIFNCAAQVSHTESMVNPFLDLEINCIGNLNLLEAVRKFNDDARIVYAGTRSQVGSMMYKPVDEDHPEFSRDIYSANKSAAEKYHLIYHSAYGMYTTCMRITNAYGPRAQVKNSGYGVVNFFIGLALREKEISVYAPGQQTRDLIYVDDVVNALLAGAQNPNANGEAFFVGSGKEIRLLDLAKKIATLSGTGTVTEVPWPDERKRLEVGDVSVDIRKIADRLGWVPLTTIDEGLRTTLDFYRQNLWKYI